MFLSPIFYPLDALPKQFHVFILFNPLTIPVEQTRALLIFGEIPNLQAYFIYLSISILICNFGFWFFQKTRRVFADVI